MQEKKFCKLLNSRVFWYQIYLSISTTFNRHGEKWYKFRTRVQQIMLQPRTAKLYVKPIEETATAFVKRAQNVRNSNLEVPDDFLNEIHKWSLECKYSLCMSFLHISRKTKV